MKIFSFFSTLTFHFIAATTFIGLAIGYGNTPGNRPMELGILIGLAAGTAISCFVRLFNTLD
jgi:hypothetical protein